MSASMTANAWCILFSDCAMCFVSHCIFLLVVSSTADACTVCFLFAILVNPVCTLVLLDGGISAHRVFDPVLCAGAVVVIAGFFFGYILLFSDFCLATGFCSTLGTTGVDTVDTCLVGCVIDLL